MNEVLISIIIPAHNAESTIEKAVYSVLKQEKECDKFEILVVENGSTDHTCEVVEKLEEQYACVHLLYSDKGVSAARNKGIEAANGEWLVFLDADDELAEDAMEVLLRDATASVADICLYGHMNGEEKRTVYDKDSLSFFSGKEIEDALAMMLSNPTRYLQVWAKLIRKSIVVNHELKFDANLRLAEDSDFFLRCVEKAQSVKINPEIIYHYKISTNSVMRSFDKDKVDDYAYSMEATGRLLALNSNQLKIAYAKYVAMHFNVAMVRETFSCDNPCSFKQKMNSMISVYKNSVFSKNIDMIPLKDCVSPRFLSIACMKCRFYIGAAVIYILRAKQNKMREISQ